MHPVAATNPYEPPRHEGHPPRRATGRRIDPATCGVVAQFAGFGCCLAALVILYLQSTLGYVSSRGLVPWGIASGAVGGLLLLVGCIPGVLEMRTRLRELNQAIAELRGPSR